MHLLELPPDMLRQIRLRLDAKSRCALRRTCQFLAACDPAFAPAEWMSTHTDLSNPLFDDATMRHVWERAVRDLTCHDVFRAHVPAPVTMKLHMRRGAYDIRLLWRQRRQVCIEARAREGPLTYCVGPHGLGEDDPGQATLCPFDATHETMDLFCNLIIKAQGVRLAPRYYDRLVPNVS